MGRGSGGWLRPQCTTYSQPVDVLRRLGCNRRVVQTATHCSMHERVSIAPCSWQKHLRRRLQIACWHCSSNACVAYFGLKFWKVPGKGKACADANPMLQLPQASSCTADCGCLATVGVSVHNEQDHTHSPSLTLLEAPMPSSQSEPSGFRQISTSASSVLSPVMSSTCLSLRSEPGRPRGLELLPAPAAAFRVASRPHILCSWKTEAAQDSMVPCRLTNW